MTRKGKPFHAGGDFRARSYISFAQDPILEEKERLLVL